MHAEKSVGFTTKRTSAEKLKERFISAFYMRSVF